MKHKSEFIPGMPAAHSERSIHERQADRHEIFATIDTVFAAEALQKHIEKQMTERAAQRLHEEGRLVTDEVSDERAIGIAKFVHESIQDTREASYEYKDVNVEHERIASRYIFGEYDHDAARKDALEKIKTPESERAGDELVNPETGEIRRPFVDISFDAEEKAAVLQQVEKRSQAYKEARQLLEAQKDTLAVKDKWQIAAMLQEVDGLYGLASGTPLTPNVQKDSLYANGSRRMESATIADFYLSEDDMANMEAIDGLLQHLDLGLQEGQEFSLVAAAADRVEKVAESMLPSGVELMTAMPSSAVANVVDNGKLTARHKRRHTKSTDKTMINGGFVHFSAPGLYGEAYGDAVVGIPIDTIVEETPYLQLEGGFVRQSSAPFGKSDQLARGSVQEKLSGVVINDVDTLPYAARQKLTSMQSSIDQYGMICSTTNGGSNNYSFAKTGEAATAFDGEYTLDGATIYMPKGSSEVDFVARKLAYSEAGASLNISGSPESMRDHEQYTQLAQARESVAPRGIVEGDVLDLNVTGSRIKNFSIQNGMRVYMPVESRKVDFTEAMGNEVSAGLELSIDTVERGNVHRLTGDLLAKAKSREEVLEVLNAVAGEIAYMDAHPEEFTQSSQLHQADWRGDLRSAVWTSYFDKIADIDNELLGPREMITFMGKQEVARLLDGQASVASNHLEASLQEMDASRQVALKQELLAALLAESGKTEADPADGFWGGYSASGEMWRSPLMELLDYQPSEAQKAAAQQRAAEVKRQAEELSFSASPDFGFGDFI